MKRTIRITVMAVMGVSFGIKVQAQAITDTGDKVGIGTTTPQSKLHVVGNENGGLIVNHNYKYGYPNYGIKIIGDQSTTKSGEVTLSVYGGGAYSGFDLAHGATYYGSGAYKTGANVNSSSRIIGYGGSLRFYTNANLAENTNFSPTQRMVINSSGNVGIGTSSPRQKLELFNTTAFNNNMEFQLQDHILLSSSHKNNGEFFGGITWESGGRRRASIVAVKEHDDADYVGLSFFTKGKDGPGSFFESMRISHRGNVGIGTITPDMKLTVKGNIHAEEVKIDLNVPAPDYVFKSGYKLRSLEEVENFIKEHSHLPEIPSAKEFAKNGVMQAAMDMNLLKKIEELTLYTIEQEKNLKAQREEIKELKKQNSKIESQEKEIEELKKQNSKIQELVKKLIEDKK